MCHKERKMLLQIKRLKMLLAIKSAIKCNKIQGLGDSGI